MKQPGCGQRLYGVFSSYGIKRGEKNRGKTAEVSPRTLWLRCAALIAQASAGDQGQGTVALLPAALAARDAARGGFLPKMK